MHIVVFVGKVRYCNDRLVLMLTCLLYVLKHGTFCGQNNSQNRALTTVINAVNADYKKRSIFTVNSPPKRGYMDKVNPSARSSTKSDLVGNVITVEIRVVIICRHRERLASSELDDLKGSCFQCILPPPAHTSPRVQSYGWGESGRFERPATLSTARPRTTPSMLK